MQTENVQEGGSCCNQSCVDIDGKYHGLNAQEGGSCKLEYKNGWNIQNLSYILEACGVVNISSVSRLTFHGPFLVMYDAPQNALCAFSLPSPHEISSLA